MDNTEQTPKETLRTEKPFFPPFLDEVFNGNMPTYESCPQSIELTSSQLPQFLFNFRSQIEVRTSDNITRIRQVGKRAGRTDADIESELVERVAKRREYGQHIYNKGNVVEQGEIIVGNIGNIEFDKNNLDRINATIHNHPTSLIFSPRDYSFLISGVEQKKYQEEESHGFQYPPVAISFISTPEGYFLSIRTKDTFVPSKKDASVEFWDHGYNLYKGIPLLLVKPVANKLTFHTGLSDPHGKMTGMDYNIKLGNDDPQDYTDIFSSNPSESKTLQYILQYDVIIFKNCFPTTKIESDEKLERYKKSYRDMRLEFERQRDRLFIPFTPPPLRKEVTLSEYAHRAQALARWMVSSDFHQNKKNIKVFDFFNLLADTEGYLKKEYCSIISFDSHPNRRANEEIAPIFVDFLIKSLQSF